MVDISTGLLNYKKICMLPLVILLARLGKMFYGGSAVELFPLPSLKGLLNYAAARSYPYSIGGEGVIRSYGKSRGYVE